ncbi:peptidoglycan DD-metalloendopeptidase family protein [Zhenpiania hominis]|uniref:Peptidoglycan DD-metalloendopeptidase family protein n=1 Tax=Zhenpiania hominis TaxID=2763644 RepID=A0A923NKH1_9FIRM|nr:peptidoglycan DD-metalloendopeptidase family protein [Zhenpiania hominis]MBC6678275.1 peptidoglycan DD-metalloendopeptidase family protein [Zhenpiania hominis]
MKAQVVKVAGSLFLTALLALSIIGAVVASLAAAASGSGDSVSLDESLLKGLPKPLTKEMVIGAIQSQDQYGVPVALTLAQIILESSGNKPGGLSSLAYECNNLFGMKGEGPAGSKTYYTGEQHADGSSYVVAAKFRVYHNVQESIEDHAKLLITPRYKAHTAGKTTSDEWAVAIWKAGYATDTQYPEKLKALMKRYDLYRFDQMTLEEAEHFGEGDGNATGTLQWPLAIKGTITSYFGPRSAPVPGASTFHQGIDIAAPSGTAVLAADGGTVISAEFNRAMGNNIYIDHHNGTKTRYCHLRPGDGMLVKAGQKVSKGQKIGKVGTTGTSSGNHLDFKVQSKGTYVDPLNYVKQPK